MDNTFKISRFGKYFVYDLKRQWKKIGMLMLIFSLLFGLIHLFGGLALKGYMCLKKKDFVGFFSDVISWYLLIIGLVLMLMPTSLFASIAQVSFHFSAGLKTFSYVITILGAAIIVVIRLRCSDWHLVCMIFTISQAGCLICYLIPDCLHWDLRPVLSHRLSTRWEVW